MELKDASKPAGPVTLANTYAVEVDHSVCIGAAPCSAMAPKTFGIDENGKAVILASADEDDIDTILNAARSCPVAAIRIKNAAGEVVFPD
ncbi:MAG: ferredoxin [Candidatus Moranbacteria bacterium]|nr:ferredoxin [Candidatus Moranbacteria bacterium]